MRIVGLQAHEGAIAREARHRREAVRAEILESVRADAHVGARVRSLRRADLTVRAVGRTRGHPHALSLPAELRLAGEAGRRGRIPGQLVGVVAGDDLRDAVHVDVGDDRQRAVAVASHRVGSRWRERLRAHRLARRAVVHADAHDDLGAGRIGQEARDRRATPPHSRRRLARRRIAAVHPQDISVAVEGNEAAVGVRSGLRGIIRIPPARHQAEGAVSLAVAGSDRRVGVDHVIEALREVLRGGPDRGPVGSANGPHQAQSLERSVLGTRREHREGVEDDGGLGIVLVQPDDDRGRHHLRDFREEDVAAGPATDDWVVGA